MHDAVNSEPPGARNLVLLDVTGGGPVYGERYAAKGDPIMRSAVRSMVTVVLLALIAGCSDNAEARRVKALPSFDKANEIRAGRQEEAIALYSEAIAADPQFAEAYHNRGLSYAEMYDFEHAEADLAKVKQLGLDGSRLEEAIAISKQLKQASE